MLPHSEKSPRPAYMFAVLSGSEPTRIVSAALALACLAILFRIGSIWQGLF